MSTEYRVAGENFDVMSWQQLAETLAHYLSPALAAAQYDMTDETMHDALGACHQVAKRNIDAATLLPADGKVEVVSHAAASFAGWLMMNREGHTVYKEDLQGWMVEFLESDDYKLEVSADRAHITRLQAEVERVRDAIQAEWRKSDGAWIRERDSLKAEVERHKLQSHCHLQRAKLAESELRVTKQALESLKGERNDLQSNLAKAQGLLSEASGKMYIDTQLKLRIAEFQRQSAPAAKDGES